MAVFLVQSYEEKKINFNKSFHITEFPLAPAGTEIEIYDLRGKRIADSQHPAPITATCLCSPEIAE